MKTEFWLLITAKKEGAFYSATTPKTSKNKPTTSKNQVCVKVMLDVPNSYFQLPELTASIAIPEARRDAPKTEVTMEQRIADTLKDSLGVNVTFITDDKKKTPSPPIVNGATYW